MKKWFSILTISIVAFAIMFILNMAVMDTLFDIEIIKLPKFRLTGFSGVLSRFTLKDQSEPSDPLKMVTLPLPNAATEYEERPETQENRKEEDEKGEREVEEEGEEEEEEASSQYVVLPEEISLVEHLSMTDKLVAIAILSKIDSDEISKMVEISQDGITYDELNELITTAEAYLTPSDIETLMELFHRNRILYAGKNAEK